MAVISLETPVWRPWVSSSGMAFPSALRLPPFAFKKKVGKQLKMGRGPRAQLKTLNLFRQKKCNGVLDEYQKCSDSST
jgi:hypothetical protein